MSNPTFGDIFSSPSQAVADAFSTLEIVATDDPRYCVWSLLNKLYDNIAGMPQANRPKTYTVTKTARNTDIDTQRQTFTFTFDMALTTNGVEDEPVTA